MARGEKVVGRKGIARSLVKSVVVALVVLGSATASWGHSIVGIDVISWEAPTSRLTGLGANVTVVSDAASAVAALSTNDVLFLGCCGYDDDFTPAQVASILAFVSGGGGLIVGQPNKTGAVGILPAGFEVSVDDFMYADPSNLYITPVGSTHGITSELTGAEISGNFDTVHIGDIGTLWDVLVMQTGTDLVALLAGYYGGGRLVFETSGHHVGMDPGSDHYVQNLVYWAAQGGGQPPAIPEPATVLLLGAGLVGLGLWGRKRMVK